MRQEQINIYKFSELSDGVKTKVLDKFRDFNTDHNWYEFHYDRLKEDAPQFGIENINFSGFYSQGDGAMFTYSWVDVARYINELDLPEWKKDVLIYHGAQCKGTHVGNYSHYNSCQHWFSFEYPRDTPNIVAFCDEWMGKVEQAIKDDYKTLCNALYRDLETDYDYLTSDEAIQESIEANEYEFFQNGTLYHN